MATNTDVLEKEKTGLPSQEKIEMSEADLIAGLLEATDYETNEDLMKKIEVKRAGKLLFEFVIRPLSEKEMQKIRKASTKMYNNPDGKRLPKIEGELRIEEYRSRKIYEATTDEYKAKLWDNPKVIAGVKAKGKDILEFWEIIDAVLMAGEKLAIAEKIDDISGYGKDDEEVGLEDYAKN